MGRERGTQGGGRYRETPRQGKSPCHRAKKRHRAERGTAQERGGTTNGGTPRRGKAPDGKNDRQSRTELVTMRGKERRQGTGSGRMGARERPIKKKSTREEQRTAPEETAGAHPWAHHDAPVTLPPQLPLSQSK
ncbi:unnamed protein product [Boreogadus saida]